MLRFTAVDVLAVIWLTKKYNYGLSSAMNYFAIFQKNERAAVGKSLCDIGHKYVYQELGRTGAPGNKVISRKPTLKAKLFYQYNTYIYRTRRGARLYDVILVLLLCIVVHVGTIRGIGHIPRGTHGRNQGNRNRSNTRHNYEEQRQSAANENVTRREGHSSGRSARPLEMAEILESEDRWEESDALEHKTGLTTQWFNDDSGIFSDDSGNQELPVSEDARDYSSSSDMGGFSSSEAGHSNSLSEHEELQWGDNEDIDTPTDYTDDQEERTENEDDHTFLYSLRGPPDAVLNAYRRKQTAQLERTLYLVVIDAGSTKTNADLWSTTVTTSASQTPVIDWTNMQILKAADDVIAKGLATLLAPLFQNAQREIVRRVTTGKRVGDVVLSIPVIVHSTAGLRDMDAKQRKDLFRILTLLINGMQEGDEIYDMLLEKERRRYYESSASGRNQSMVTVTNPSVDYRRKQKKLKNWENHSNTKSYASGPTRFQTRFEFNVPPTGSPSGRKTLVMRFFTTRHYCRAITGIEEAVFTFITANIARGVIQGMRDSSAYKEKLGGILEVGGASMQVVFPVENQIYNGPLGTLDLTLNDRFLRRDMFPWMTGPFNVFGTSYMNLGINRALALLQKQFCQQKENRDAAGRCFFPCLQSGWRQRCIPGSPSLGPQKSKTSDRAGSPFQLDDDGRVVVEGNNLVEVANFCSNQNPFVRNMLTPLLDCRRAGFDVSISKTIERAQIHGCTEIVGTGNAPKCYDIISALLFHNELPGNQETLSETGAAAPAEIGRFMAPKGLMYVVGNSLVFPIQQLKDWKMLEVAYYKVAKEVPRRCDYTNLWKAAKLLCSLSLSEAHTFFNPKANETISLNQHNYDYCYKSVYATALLNAINVTRGNVQVQFEAHIKHVGSKQVLDFGWTYGAITNLVIRPRFVTDLFALGPEFYRSSRTPLKLALHQVAE